MTSFWRKDGNPYCVVGAGSIPARSNLQGSPPGGRPGKDAGELTLPPVTEKLAKMQYFSFLWPVYVFKH